MVVVPGGEPLDVGLQDVLVQVPRAGDEGEDPLFLRLHDAVQRAVAEGLVAFEFDLVDADESAFRHGVRDVHLALADRRRRVGDGGVEVTLLAVELLRRLDAVARALRVEDGVRTDAQRLLDLFLLDVLRAVDRDRPDERPLVDVEGEHQTSALAGGLGRHLVEEAHRVDGANVLVEGVLVERRAGLRLQVDADGVFLDAHVADDVDLADRPFGRMDDRRAEREDDPDAERQRTSAPHPHPFQAVPPCRATGWFFSSCTRP